MTPRALPRRRRAARHRPSAGLVAAVAAALWLSACANPPVDRNFEAARQLSREHLGVEVRWLRSEAARVEAQREAEAVLSRPLQADDAVRLALAYSPALQALLFEAAATSADVTQATRLPNPVFTFERLARRSHGETELDIGRMLGLPLFDLLLLPARLRQADLRQQQTQWRLAGEVVQAATAARQAWVRAVAAEQRLHYQRQVQAAADASAELARRMQAVGNFSRLQRAREQAFSAEAAAELARAEQVAADTREALVRALGLAPAQARALTLPSRLPELPATLRDATALERDATALRLDLRIARAELQHSADEQGLGRAGDITGGAHLAAVRNSETGEAPQKGLELELPLPVFDPGDAGRLRRQASHQAAQQRLAQREREAASQVRQAHAGYRSAYEVARHYRDQVVPLRKAISEENLLRYNGMLISVFELLADARQQVASVVGALDAQRDFWLADAALQAARVGPPAGGLAIEARPSAAADPTSDAAH